MSDDLVIRDAVRVAQSVSIGIVGTSGTGKTLSMLKLLRGFQMINGGDIYVIDTEGRALDYADDFKFKIIDFRGPFSSERYLEAIDRCVKAGAKNIGIDSMTDEHESEGGHLEQFEEELQKRGGGANQNAAAWIKPKAQRRKLIVRMRQMRDVNFVLTFRADDKSKPGQKGSKEWIHLGFVPIGGSNFVYGTKATAILLPGADGVPTWNPEGIGEKLFRKLPSYLKSILDDGKPLSEHHGKKIMEWAQGPAVPKTTGKAAQSLTERSDGLIAAFKKARSVEDALATWNAASRLRADLQLNDPELMAKVTLAYEGRCNELEAIDEQPV